jgi:hypothetical protein
LCAVSEYSPDRKQLVFTTFDVLKGRGRELVRHDTDPAARYGWTLSLDGTRIALLNPPEGRIHILHLDGRAPEEVEAKNMKLGDALDWSADGKGLFAVSATVQGTALSYLDLHGNTHQIWSLNARFNQSLWGIPSPDGRHLAINGCRTAAARIDSLDSPRSLRTSPLTFHGPIPGVRRTRERQAVR